MVILQLLTELSPHFPFGRIQAYSGFPAALALAAALVDDLPLTGPAEWPGNGVIEVTRRNGGAGAESLESNQGLQFWRLTLYH